MKIKLIYVLIILALVLSACVQKQPITPKGNVVNIDSNITVIYDDDDSIFLDPNNLKIKTIKGERYVVEPQTIVNTGLSMDEVIALENPMYETMQEADQWLEDNDTLYFLDIDGERKAYPQHILAWHEVINDYVAGEPVVVTYCPICRTGVAYYTIIEGEVTTFGTSGYTYQDNLVMYDRLTGTYWTQVDGIGIKGKHAGEQLVQIPLTILSWKELEEGYNDVQILSRDTGYDYDYGNDPSISYYTNGSTNNED